MTLRERMMGGAIPRWMLEESVQIAEITAQALAAGNTEADDTLNVTEVCADIQPITGGISYRVFGMERAGTHIMTVEPDVTIEFGWLVKALTGPEVGNHFRAIDIQRNRHHIEVLMDYLEDETRDDVVGAAA